MDWPTQTRAISTIHSVLREQAKVYPANTIVYPLATIHSMKSLFKKEHDYYSLDFTLSKTNFMKISKRLRSPLLSTSSLPTCERRIHPACPVSIWPCYSSVTVTTHFSTIRCHSNCFVATTCK